MNLILLFPEDFVSSGKQTVCLTGRRFQHIKEILKSSVGDKLLVGLIDDKVGTGEIVKMRDDSLEMKVTLDGLPPRPLPITVILALPRPIVLKRILITLTSLGIKEIILLNTWRVEKSFWNSPALRPENIKEQLILGLEQAKDTILPKVTLKRLFKPFVKNELANIIKGRKCFIAHPAAKAGCSGVKNCEIVVAIGPEGGFIEKEVEAFVELGFVPFSAGERILRVEAAVPYILGKLAK